MSALLEELEQAAKRVRCPAWSACFGCPGCDLSQRLSARAEHVRRIGNTTIGGDEVERLLALWKDLTGPLPEAPR